MSIRPKAAYIAFLYAAPLGKDLLVETFGFHECQVRKNIAKVVFKATCSDAI